MGRVIDRSTKMAMFDALPPRVREAVRLARYSWPVHELHQRMGSGETEEQLVALIKALDEKTYRERCAA